MQVGYVAESALGYFQSAAAGFDAATLLTSITGLTAGITKGAVLLLIVPEAQAVRWRDDGTAPTTAIGQPLAVGAELRYTAHNLANLRFISQSAGALLNVTVYGH